MHKDYIMKDSALKCGVDDSGYPLKELTEGSGESVRIALYVVFGLIGLGVLIILILGGYLFYLVR